MNETGDRKKSPLGAAGWIALIVLAGFLAAAIWYAIHGWLALSGVAISGLGWLFLTLGIVATVGVGVVLMGLVFYSSRHRYDR